VVVPRIRMVVATVAETKKQKRALSGVLLFDKSTGFSSNQALQIVKRLYRAEKQATPARSTRSQVVCCL